MVGVEVMWEVCGWGDCSDGSSLFGFLWIVLSISLILIMISVV